MNINVCSVLLLMLFLIGAVPKQEFIQGMYAAATTTPNATYSPIAKNGNPATSKAGAAFPGNDWIAFRTAMSI